MKIFSAVAALLLASLTSHAAVLIFDGPAPAKEFGPEQSPRRNHAMLVFDNTSGKVGLVNYYIASKEKQQAVPIWLEADATTIPTRHGSYTAVTGVHREVPAQDDFRTLAISFRGRNSSLNLSTQLIGPRVISGILRSTERAGSVSSHFEQSFSMRYEKKLSNAANDAGDTFEDALSRVRLELQRRGYAAQVL